MSLAVSTMWIDRDGLLVEPRLAASRLKHGFTSRRLGDMTSPECRAKAAALIGVREPLTLKQVHGTVIHEASVENAGKEGDGWILSKPSVAAAVYVADCVPLYLWSDDFRLAGVFHAGWRGTARGMATAAVAAFAARGVPAARLHAALGPHAGVCCYRVGPELQKDFPAESFVRREGGLYLDLAAQTRRQLTSAGVPAARLGGPAPCTVCGRLPDGSCGSGTSSPAGSVGSDYFSFRRDKQGARMFAVLSLDLWPS